jgi:HK97 family phage major capsid protein
MFTLTNLIAAAVIVALLAVWLALEPARLKAIFTAPASVAVAVVRQPAMFPPTLWAYLGASGQGREGMSKRTLRSPSKRAWRLRGVYRAFRKVGLVAAWESLRNPTLAKMFAFPICGADGSTDVLDPNDVDLSEGEKKELKEIGEKAAKLRADLMSRLQEMKGKDGTDKEEVERREKELGEQVDRLIQLEEKRESTELTDFKAELEERLERLSAQMKDAGRRPIGPPKGIGPTVAKEDAYPGDNMFRDIVRAKKGDHGAGQRYTEYEEKFINPEREKAWAQGELEENDLILPDVQAALPFLRAQARATALFRELRTNAPSVTFPVFKSGLKAGFVKHGEAKPEAEPTFDLRVAEIFTLAGISDIPNPLLEDFPAARGWIASELGAVTGAEVEIAILSGDGTGEPLGLFENTEIPTRKLDATAKASAGRNIITSIFRGAQQVRIEGFMEPTDVLMNPAAWTDVVLSFEENIGFLYGPPQQEGTSESGPPLNTPPARILGLPVTWSSYVPANEGAEENETSIVVGNFMDGVVLRRAPFRIDVDTSVGFKKNLTSFRGEERMGFIVVRPKSFVKVTDLVPSPVS